MGRFLKLVSYSQPNNKLLDLFCDLLKCMYATQLIVIDENEVLLASFHELFCAYPSGFWDSFWVFWQVTSCF